MTMRKTYTILAVAFTTAACGGEAASEPSPQTETPRAEQSLAQELENTPLDQALANREHFKALCDEAGYPLPGNVNPKAGPTKLQEFCAAVAPPVSSAPSSPHPQPLPAAPPAAACDRDALNRELSQLTPLPDALAHAEHFRCLCDEQGYPLVGNINAKGTTASAFCAALREQGQGEKGLP